MSKLDLQAPVETLFESNSMSSNPMVKELNDEDTLSITNDLSGSSIQAHSDYSGYYWDWYAPYRGYVHQEYHRNTKAENFEIAFKLARKLMEKKVVKPQKTIEDFFKLMDVITEAL